MITGVSKFSKVSIFSELNKLEDITIDRRFTTLVGITQQELEDNFEAHLSDSQQLLNMNRETLLAHIPLFIMSKYYFSSIQTAPMPAFQRSLLYAGISLANNSFATDSSFPHSASSSARFSRDP